MAKEELFLDPLIVSQRYHLCYVVVGSLAAVLWDIMIHLRADFRLFRKSGVRLPQILYILSRATTVAFLLCETVLLTSQVGSYCGVLQTVVTSLGSLHYTSTGLLHLLRVRVVYLDRPWVLRFFCLSWVISSGTTIAIGPFLLDGATIAGNSCMHTHLNTTLQQISFAINIIQGTCIVLATSSGFVLTPADFPFVKKIGFFQRVKASVTANGLPAFSKSLLRHGQGYYLLLLCTNLFTAIGISIQAIPVAYRIGMLVADYSVLHCAACSIFRNLGKARYVTQEPTDDLPLSFYRGSISAGSPQRGASSTLQDGTSSVRYSAPNADEPE